LYSFSSFLFLVRDYAYSVAKAMSQKWNSFEEAVAETWKANPQRTEQNIRERLQYSIGEVCLN
jgi:hypothetical protein